MYLLLGVPSASFKQQDTALRIRAQSCRKNGAGRAATYNNNVEGLFGSGGPWLGQNIAFGYPHDLYS